MHIKMFQCVSFQQNTFMTTYSSNFKELSVVNHFIR